MSAAYETLISCAVALDQYTPPPLFDAHLPGVGSPTGDRPGDVFEGRHNWADVLVPAGWAHVYDHAGLSYWRRPGKQEGTSATTGVRSNCGRDLLFVFSSNAHPFEPDQSYSKFAAFTLLHHSGDFQAAAKALATAGYGDPAQPAGRIKFSGSGNGHAPVPEKLRALAGQQVQAVECCSHDELLDADLPPLRWVVEGLVPDEGLTILGGKKKLGKSWLCLQIAQAVAQNAACLGRDVSAGSVVYLCLEDGKRRLKSRLEKQQASRGLPVTYYTRFPKLDGGDGMSKLIEVVEERKPRLLIVDTLAAAKTGKTEENAAGPMADMGNALRAIAQHYRLGIIVTHHHGKLTGGDPGDDLRGSSALAGAADVNLGIYRGESGFALKGEGRDIQALHLAMTFDANGAWTWAVTGDQRGAVRDQADQEVINAIRALGESDAATVGEYLGKSRQKTADRLRRLAAGGVLTPRAVNGEHGGSARILYRLSDTFYAEEIPD